jgi:hypothetical protein
VFGCSYTFGIGLPGCEEGSKEPSKLGWPTIVSNKLNLELVNTSVSGASNFEILHKIINFNFYETDTIIIMWTHYARDLFFKNWNTEDSLVRLGPWSLNKSSLLSRLIDTHVVISRNWIENMNDKTFALKTWANIHHADLYLQSKKLRYIHYPANPYELLEYPVSYKINNLYLDGVSRVDLGCDKSHPGVMSNKQTAKNIYKLLNEQF